MCAQDSAFILCLSHPIIRQREKGCLASEGLAAEFEALIGKLHVWRTLADLNSIHSIVKLHVLPVATISLYVHGYELKE